MSESERERAARRAAWPVARHPLGQEPADDWRDVSPAERFAAMAQLAVDAWILSGRELPSYERHEAPGRLTHGLASQDQ